MGDVIQFPIKLMKPDGFIADISKYYSNNPYVTQDVMILTHYGLAGSNIAKKLGLFNHVPEFHGNFPERLTEPRIEKIYGPPRYHGMSPKDYLHLV